MANLTLSVKSMEAMLSLGKLLGSKLRGSEIFELVGDVGTGKTTFVKGIARGLDIDEVVQSPTFTISRIYEARDSLKLHHYDFYRLAEAGIMRDELAESLEEKGAVVALEWDETVQDLLPPERTVRIEISYIDEHSRRLHVALPDNLNYLQPALEEYTS